jgi:L-2,4-diaminobutyrate decarboxylase
MHDIPVSFPELGLGEDEVYRQFRQNVETRSAMLRDELAFAHMDPPTPEIASGLVGINACYNQNLLHPDLSPFATQAERRVIGWIAPAFGMTAGHMCSGSTLANLTALWRAREAGATRVIASADAHISVPKSAHLLGMTYEAVVVTPGGQLNRNLLNDTSNAAIVLTAGTTGRGVIDSLDAIDAINAKWVHVDAAWAGPLIFTKYAALLAGIDRADSVAISAHKWLYQPKESAIILFADPDAQAAISFGGDYLAVPNVGVQGSRGAAAIPLLATLLSWGKTGLAQRIEKNMADAEKLAAFLHNDLRTELKQFPETGVINWRPVRKDADEVYQLLGHTASKTKIDGETWLRHVAVNPYANVERIWVKISDATQ